MAMASNNETQIPDALLKLSHSRAEDNKPTTSRVPSRLRFGDDANDDVTAPTRGKGAPAQYMNQSIFGMIATAGSTTDLNKRYDQSSDSEGDSLAQRDRHDKSRTIESAGSKSRKTTSSEAVSRKGSEHKQELPTPSRIIRPAQDRPGLENAESESDESDQTDPSNAPMMSRLLTAEARYKASEDTQIEDHASRRSMEKARERADYSPATLLATRLLEIFGFEAPENVLAEYPCWLLQSVLLEGYLYLTKNHICFYAYLPKHHNTASKTGFLSKRGKSNPRYRRYWFELKGDVLSYFVSSSDKYFPQGTIDLRYGISAAVMSGTEKPEDLKDFSITTDHRTYYFRAESATSAKEWVKTIQRTIFRSHNDSDSVKIALSFENVLDVEESPVLGVADTIKVRVIESKDTYAIDEYFFAFFDAGKEVMKILGDLIDKVSDREVNATNFVEKATESAHMQQRSPGTATSARREELDSSAPIRIADPTFHDAQDSQNISATDRETDSSLTTISQEADTMSASQILSRSDVFHTPKIRRMSTVLSASTTDTNNASDEDRPPRDLELAADTIHSPLPQQSQFHLESTSHANIGRTSSPTLQGIVKAGSYPLQRAGALAGYLKNRSGKMSTYLATESMSYLEKVSGMWSGSRQHYGENEGVVTDDHDVDPEDEEANVGHGDRFRAHFALPSTEKLQATYFGYLSRVLPLYGKIYISNNKFCFRSLLPGTRTKLILPIKDIENVDKEKGFRFGYHGLVIVIRGHEELFFEFKSSENRDDCTVTLLQALESVKYLAESVLLAQPDKAAADAARAEHLMLQEARRTSVGNDAGRGIHDDQSRIGNMEQPPILFDDGKASIINFKPAKSMRITCLTIGSRGDVQPYIALCKALMAEGHKVRIATHAEFGPWIVKHGIDHAAVGGDPAELMRICVENGMFTYSFLREATSKFRDWVDDLLTSAWQACAGSDIIIESPSAMAGIHIAEALGVPYFRAFTMPWTRTRAYPHAFAVPDHKHGGAYNLFSYVMFDNVFWKGIAGQINRWRRRDLKLPSTSLEKMQQHKVPFLYNFSPQVVPPPLDYSHWVRITGYWFLDEGEAFKPPLEMLQFIQKARRDKKKLVYIGFGSIVVSDPAALTRTVVESVLKADVRCILSKGWSDRLGDPSAQKAEVPLPEEILQIQSAPHDWLFKQIDAAVHHGGAGTTGASLRAGVPTIAKPFFGDQFFFGGRIEDLGVGICLKKINVSVLARALWEAVHSERMIVKARLLGNRIRAENGVQTAIQAIYRDLDYARDLIKAKRWQTDDNDMDSEDTADVQVSTRSPRIPLADNGLVNDASDESWTMVADTGDNKVL